MSMHPRFVQSLTLLCALSAVSQAHAATTYSTSFESSEGYSKTFLPSTGEPFYHPGSVHNQPNPGSPDDSWFENSNGGTRGEIRDKPALPLLPLGLGAQSLYLYDRSDFAHISGNGFGASSPNTSPIVDAAGETGSYTRGADAQTPGAHAATSDQIQAEFWFKAGATDITADQIFANFSLSSRDVGGVGPSRRYADAFVAQSASNAGKYALKIQEVAGTDPDNFVLTAASTGELNRDEWYRLVLSAKLVDGLAGDGSFNDIVTLSAYDVLGNLQATITGGSHEVSYKYSSAGVLRPSTDAWYNGIAINAFGYRLGSSVTPDEIGYLDNLTITSGALIPEPASIVMLGVAAAGLMLIVRRRH
jgi:hypothetical protein